MHHCLKSVQEKDPQQVRLFVVSAVPSATFVFLHFFDVYTYSVLVFSIYYPNIRGIKLNRSHGSQHPPSNSPITLLPISLSLHAIIPCFAAWILPCFYTPWHFYPYTSIIYHFITQYGSTVYIGIAMVYPH